MAASAGPGRRLQYSLLGAGDSVCSTVLAVQLRDYSFEAVGGGGIEFDPAIHVAGARVRGLVRSRSVLSETVHRTTSDNTVQAIVQDGE